MTDTPGFLAADWPAPASIRAGTTTRAGGVSAPPFASLNLGDRVDDEADAVRCNRMRLRQALALPSEPLWLNQVHGARVARAADELRGDTVAQADAVVALDRPQAVCAVLTADCLPVLICDRGGHRYGAAHAGWRGLAAGIVEATVAALDTPPRELMAWLGPSIGAHNFEVGADVRAAFCDQAGQDAIAFTERDIPGKYLTDIYALARARLERAGVTAIFGGGLCTIDDGERFFSYRRDGARTGRMASLIWRVSD